MAGGMTEIAIRGGTVIDGTGTAGRRADVLVRKGRVVEIGDRLVADRELDASDCVVAPGFIDIHTHYDAQVFWDPALTPSCFHGVTTVVAGNCGFSIAPTRPDHRETIALTLENVEDMNPATLAAGIPWEFESFPEYLASVGKRGTALNFAAFIGHTALRLFHMGDEAYERIATDEEIQAMARSVGEAIDAGAAGLATSFAPTHIGMNGKPVPSRQAELREFETLAGELGRRGRGVLQATIGQNFGFDELYEFQRRIGRPLTYTALLAIPGFWQFGSERHLEERKKGTGVRPQVSCRKLTMQMQLCNPFPFDTAACFAELRAFDRKVREARYRDPVWRKRAVDELSRVALTTRWDKFEIAESEVHPQYVGHSVSELAQKKSVHPFDLMVELSLAENLETRFRYVQSNDDEEGIAHLLQQEEMVLGLSDAGAHVGMLCDAPLPTDLLGNWVRERGTLPLETAVRKLTGEPAELFGFVDRGVLRPGAWADICIFDPRTVAPGPLRRVRDFPADADRLTADAPEGMRHVLVNGTPIRIDGDSDLGLRPGTLAEIA